MESSNPFLNPGTTCRRAVASTKQNGHKTAIIPHSFFKSNKENGSNRNQKFDTIYSILYVYVFEGQVRVCNCQLTLFVLFQNMGKQSSVFVFVFDYFTVVIINRN